MRLVYLNGDPGVPLWGSKGASVHVRQTLRTLAPRVEALTAVSMRLGEPAAETAVLPSSCRILGIGARPAGGTSARRDAGELAALGANDDVERLIDRIAESEGVDAVYERYSLWSVAGANAAARHGVPWVVEVNAPLVDEALQHRALAMPSLARFLEAHLLRRASRVVCVSRAVAEHVALCGVEPRRVRVEPNGFDERLFRPRPAAAKDPARFTVAFVGSLKPWHGVEVLVDAFVALRRADPGWRLLVVGDGPMLESIRARLAAGAPADSFELTGAVPHQDVPVLLASADVAVAPYPDLPRFYFSPLKVIEYAAMRLPVVASRVGQIEEHFADGESALLVPPGSTGALAEALLRLREDPHLRRRLGEGASRVAAGRTWDAISSRIVDLIEEARAEARPREVIAS
ncbi:MAG: glycosyltransferase family 4 protein [Candidatus Eiseniibacteriota bacterium]